jgi:hypothetical protein
MTLTAAQYDEARQKLTPEAFAARQLQLMSGKLPPLWLCTRADVQQKYLAELDAAYRSWVDEELKMLVARHDEDPLSRPGVMQNSPIL